MVLTEFFLFSIVWLTCRLSFMDTDADGDRDSATDTLAALTHRFRTN
jgi:hypothetical protein